MNCYKCGAEIVMDRKVFRQDTCPECDSYLHCCLQCRFYDPVSSHECRESEAKWAHDKEMANFCDYFEPLQQPIRKPDAAAEARKKLQSLFKKSD